MKKTLTTIMASALIMGAANGEKTQAQRIADLEARLAVLEAPSAGFGKGDSGSVATDMNLASWAKRTSIGGYGELHYNNYSKKDDTIDLHRFVLYVNHQFNDRIRFISELEVEHSIAGEGKNGEVEIEQAYIEMDFANDLQVRAGLFLIPVGIINETHEPPTFFGVERNSVEKYIIPATWWEAGVGVTKKFENGLTLDGAVTSGLNMADNGYIRGGRQKVSKAVADNIAITGRVTYTGVRGLKVSAFGQFNNDVLQKTAGSTSGVLLGATAEYQVGGFALRALYSKWSFGGDIPVGIDNSDFKSQSGWYIEPSYTFELEGDSKIGFFVRYEEADYYKAGAKEIETITAGFNYWPTENVVFKGDYQDHKDSEQFNLGVGFQF